MFAKEDNRPRPAASPSTARHTEPPHSMWPPSPWPTSGTESVPWRNVVWDQKASPRLFVTRRHDNGLLTPRKTDNVTSGLHPGVSTKDETTDATRCHHSVLRGRCAGCLRGEDGTTRARRPLCHRDHPARWRQENDHHAHQKITMDTVDAD